MWARGAALLVLLIVTAADPLVQLRNEGVLRARAGDWRGAARAWEEALVAQCKDGDLGDDETLRLTWSRCDRGHEKQSTHHTCFSDC